MTPYTPPRFSPRALRLTARNFLVWRKLIASSIVVHLVEPLIFLAGFGLGVGTLVGDVGDIPYLEFVAAGMIGFSVANTASFEALYSAVTRMHVQRTWESVLHAPMTVDDIVFGEWLWAGFKSAFAAMSMLLILSILGLATYPAALLILPTAIVGGLAFAGIALVCNALARGYEFFSFYFSLFITPMLILSGVFFPVETLPAPLAAVSVILPLRHLIDIIRPALGGEFPPSLIWHLIILTLYGGGGLWAATIITRRRFLS